MTLINQSSLSSALREILTLRVGAINYYAILKVQIHGKSNEETFADNIDYLQTRDKKDLGKFFDKIFSFNG